ncbi:hypothetical protein [Pseudomonas hygromyciniae]|uniref:hypothetical protein n=1 Tax=Pseudomonas hygromyciniae TaxID=2812000 RepID=UPI001F075E3C|nr:hypothetical protein [Pseudomonas hygromyciniae]
MIDAAGNELALPDWLSEMRPPSPGRKTLRPSQTVLFVPGVQMKNVPDLNQVLAQCADELNCLRVITPKGVWWLPASMAPCCLPVQGYWMVGAQPHLDDCQLVRVHLSQGAIGDGRPGGGRRPGLHRRSPAAVCDLMVELIRHFAGEEMAQIATNGLLYHPMRFEHSSLNFPGISVKTRDSVVFRAKQWLQQHIQMPYSLDAVAQAATASPRTLLRHFKEVEA